MNQQPRSKRPFIIISLVVATAGIVGITYVLKNTGGHPGQSGVKVNVLPTYASVTIDGQAVSKTAYLSPGSHTVVATSPGWVTETKAYNLDPKVAVSIELALSPISSDATKWYNDHQSLFAAQQGRASANSQKAGKSFQDENPIVSQLPYENYLYTIGYKLDPSDPTNQSIILTIDAPVGYRNGAVQQIRNLGFDPADFKIEFTNYEDPFTK